MNDIITILTNLTGINKVLFLLSVAIFAHIVVKTIEWASFRLSSLSRSGRTKTVAILTTSLLIFAIYFTTIGVILVELGVSLGTYIASASVIGIAVGFGTQNVVQDVINGITIIVTDLFTVDDMVEISGQTGIVQQVSMRFVVLKNPLGAKVYIPTRTVTNVINYPRGYVRCLVDISINDKITLTTLKDDFLNEIINGFNEQFPGILRAGTEIMPIQSTASGKHYIRVKFRIWPGRGSAIETVFKQDVIDSLKCINSEKEFNNSVFINYEISH